MTTTQTQTQSQSHETVKPASQLILVRVRMGHVSRYRRDPEMTLLYQCSFPVTVGTTVLVPPTRLYPKWQRGTVVRVDADRGDYRGRIKGVCQLGRRRK